MAARLLRLVVALALTVGVVLPSPAAAVVRLTTSQQSAASVVPARGANAANARSYFGARYYRADIGRFATVDPVTPWQSALVNPQLWNRYAYGLNNPLRYVDPDGRCIWDVCVAEGAGLYVVGAAAVATTAWLVSPSGQQAVRQVVNDTGAIITTAAGAIRSWFETEKRPGTLVSQTTATRWRKRQIGSPALRNDP
jgi:RHS repeat-associated protein